MADTLEHLFSAQASGQQPSAIREICRLVDQPDMKSLAGGWPDPAVFPAREIAEIAAEVLAKEPERVLQYGTTEGLPRLRRAIAALVGRRESLSLTADDILILHGSQQGMDLLTRVLLDPGDTVLAGLPTYFGGTGAVTARGGQVAGVPLDEYGLDVDALERKIAELKAKGERVKGLYVIPNFQNPTGRTLPLERRARIVELAEINDFLIFEDDPYGELRFEGERLPSLFSLDKNGRTALIRSFSKIFAPGMRLAWMAAHPALLRKCAISKQFVDCCTNSLAQHIGYEFIARGLLEKRIDANIAFYRKKRDAVLALLERHFPHGVSYNRPEGGFFLFVHLPEHLDAADLLRDASERKVVFVAGAPFFVNGSGKNTFRISYSQTPLDDIETAIKVLGELIGEALRAD